MSLSKYCNELEDYLDQFKKSRENVVDDADTFTDVERSIHCYGQCF